MKPIFRSAMFGYNKNDVFNFINKLNKQCESKLADLSAELQNQESEFAHEREAFRRDTEELETYRNTAIQTQELLARVAQVVSDILKDREKLVQCASVISEEKSEDQARLADMSVRVREAEKLRQKAEKFDQLSGVLSSIFNQPDMEKAVPDACSEQETVSEQDADFRSVNELSDLLAVLGSHCEKLQSILPREE